VTTLRTYDFELSYADRSSHSGAISSSHARGRAAFPDAAHGGLMTETAAQHVLAAVTDKAKRLFALLGRKQLEAIEESSSGNEDAGAFALQRYAMSYNLLFAAARDDFIATNDTALRALLGEFRDHGLIVSSSNGAEGGESLWIPLPKNVLTRVIK